jgi:urate oxidase
MGERMIKLGANRYGKAETRIVRVSRDGDRHDVTDLNVSVALAGDLDGTHLHGDNSNVLPTDTQKNTVYAFARQYGIGQIEAFALRLARHFVDSQPPIHHAEVGIEQYGWRRLGPHSFERDGGETRTARVRYDGARAEVSSGLTGLVLLNSTDSEFHGFIKDRYTTLPETRERILATAVTAHWRHAGDDSDWAQSYAQTRRLLVEAFADTYSLALQQTLYAMGQRVLEQRPELVKVTLSLPNKHHFLVDLTPFGLDNPDEVYYAADRPYGLIEGTVRREDYQEVPWTF